MNTTQSTAHSSQLEDSEQMPSGTVPMLRRCLQLIFAIAAFGTAFSGVLTFREFFNPAAEACSPLGSPDSIFGQPPCLYGLVMYGLIVFVAGYGLVRTARTGEGS